ncbi:cytochrome c oxidase subunit I [Paraburkholderia sp. MMS20-SJTN17]|uniref:cytochrome-c oxidase n=1 Tax=Paraburkholderia translucens TaxID=2886945 RepID=A0ABS8KDZ7_9BURK|nr:cytochrome c oxidase subunit I [Paraburkholderia sp. MMS20-SJTN17]MCC8402674.1 cytochrome c oxidase subunit I [Paraburkholderia sp. MMS20-SJTN17]
MSTTSGRSLVQAKRSAFRREPERGRVPQGSDAEKRLREIWEGEPGWRGFFTTVDHKKIGLRYIVTAFGFLLIGGVEALLMRLQLAQPNETLLSPEQYAQLFTMHGVTMIFLYALPVLSGFANYLWPLMLGSRDMAFPRLNALSYWVFLFAGLFLYCSFPFGEAPNAGWFNYVPFSSLQYNRGPNIDVYALGMVLLGISTTVGAINFVVTLFRMRAVGMSIDRLPIIVWGTLTVSFANLFAVPSVSLAFFLLWMDRNVGTHFFDVSSDGRPLLWQHLFWMFAHPWVYVVALPAMGIVSDGLPTFCRRPLVAYAAVAMSTVATMIIGFEVWIHHMFATGIAPLALAFFGAASVLISIPSAVAVFAWIATIWTGCPVFAVPFLYFASFVLMFVVGGVSGVMTAAVPLDWQLNETYFIVAHLHYVLLGINVFPVLGGITYWFPKFTGRLMNERLGKIAFWIVFVGFNLGFFPMHISGLLGMPRRVYTYPDGMGWDTSNLITTIGSFVLGVGIVLFVINALLSARRGKKSPPNPWDAPGLEWSVASPPPPYNFAVLPIVQSRHPMWEDRLQPTGRRSSLEEGYLLHDGREALGVQPFSGKPDVILKMPEDAWSPFFLGLFAALAFLTMLLHFAAGTVIALVGCGVTLIAWLWPRRSLAQREPPTPEQMGPKRTALNGEALPVGSAGEHSGGWWGVLALVATEASLFGYLLFSYFYSQSQTQLAWPPEGMPKIGVGALSTSVLILSSVFAWFSERTLKKSRRSLSFVWMLVAIVLGFLFVGIQLKEWHDHPYGLTAHLYGSLYFTITGFHMAHVLVGLVILGLLATWIALGYFDEQRSAPLRIGGIYWHFVDVVWLFIFTSLYATPFWMRGQ